MLKPTPFSLNHNYRPMQPILTKKEVELSGKRILVIANPKIGENKKFGESLEFFCSQLAKTINENEATDVFIVGYLISGRNERTGQQMNDVMQSLGKLPALIHIIVSKAERMAMGLVEDCKCDIINEYMGFFSVELSNETMGIFICDDVGNDYSVSYDAGCKFVMFLKSVFANQIQPNAFLISGHVTPAFLDISGRVGSPGTFAYEYDKIEYLFIDIDKAIGIQIFTEVETEEYPVKTHNPQPRNVCIV